jgi:NAD(P) transhydrogenase
VSAEPERFDLIVVGAGPAGQKAAVQGAKAGQRVLVVDRDAAAGGECVRRGTIPSKTLRESAVSLASLRDRCGGVLDAEMPPDLKVEALMRRKRAVLASQERSIEDQLARNGIARWRGHARFLSASEVEVREPRGAARRVRARTIVIATGSRPRTPPEIPVDHEHVLDSDSILSLLYLPRSLTVLGSGVIASEFASIFGALGVEVTVVDRNPRPLGFLDPELTERFVAAFERHGGRFRGGCEVESVRWDGVASVVTRLATGEVLRSEKCLCALGRVANVELLGLAAAGLETTPRGLIEVDEHCRTAVPGIYAVGDVIGPPALAATAVEQGRRAVRHALGLEVAEGQDIVPTGIYTIPEMASVGLTEAQALERHGDVLVGRAPFAEFARGQIAGDTSGLLKLVAAPDGRRLLGAHIVGEGATELVHVAQMAMLGGVEIETLVDTIFNFPTLAEAYRVAALDVLARRAQRVSRAA